jgi:hypothetical protein
MVGLVCGPQCRRRLGAARRPHRRSATSTTPIFLVAGDGPLTNPVSQSASLEANIVRLRLGKLF